MTSSLPRPRAALAAALVVAAVSATGLVMAAPAHAQPTSPRARHQAHAWEARLGDNPSWFKDPLTKAQRKAEITIPKSPADRNGTAKKYTVARLRTHAGDLAVPARMAYGHQLVVGQALTFDGASLFKVGSARLTPQARTLITRLAYSMSNVAGVTCEGYTDYGSRGLKSYRPLSQRRAESLCHALAAQTDLTTQSVGYASTRPAVVGSRNPVRNANRRAVLLVTADVSGNAPTITAGSSAYNDGTGNWDFNLTWTGTDSVAGSPGTVYEWSLDGTTWALFTVHTYTPGSPNTGTLDSGISGCAPVGSSPVYVREASASNDAPASAPYSVSYGFVGFAPVAARRC